MNGKPSAEQERWHENLRELGCIVTNKKPVEIHHIFGARWKAKIYDENHGKIYMPGEWLVNPHIKTIHDAIDENEYTFEQEKQFFIAGLMKYQCWFDHPAPVPLPVIKYYKAMLSAAHIPK